VNNVYGKSYGLLPKEVEDDCHGWDCDSDDDPLPNNGPIASAVNLSRGGYAKHNDQRNQNAFANIRGLSKAKKKTNNAQSQLRILHTLQRQKLIQFHKSFRRKQRQFQDSLYALNSRSNPYFPRPPYNLWRIESGPGIGKTTLTGKIFLLNIAAFALQTAYPSLTAWGAKRSDLLLNGQELHRLITPIFLHGGIGHLMTNSYSLKNMGMNVERAFGPTRFLAVYFASGIVGNIFSAVKSPNPAVGASGAIFGLVGAYYTFLSRNEQFFGYSAQMQQNALIETIGMNLLLGMTNPMIDNWGHIGGFVGGVGMSYLFGPKLYVVRVPARGDSLDVRGVGMGKVVIDRPTIAFRLPLVLEERLIVVRENVRDLGVRISSAASQLLNPDSDTHLFFDGTRDSENEGVYELVNGKDEVAELPNNVNVTPMDGLRQNVSELDRVNRQYVRRRRKSTPRPGRSLKPRYGHLYR